MHLTTKLFINPSQPSIGAVLNTLKINCYTLLFNIDIYDLRYGISGIYGISVQDINKS